MDNRIAALVGGSFGALGAALGRAEEAKKSRIFGSDNIRRYIQHVRKPFQYRSNAGNFDPRINRHTGKPHLHRREIVRRMTKPGSPERKAGMEAIRHART